MRRYGERGRRLLGLTRALGSVGHMDEVSGWLRTVAPAFRCEQGYVSLLNAVEKYVETVAGVGWEPTGDRFWLDDYPRTASLLGQREPIIIRADDPEADAAETELLHALHVRSVLMAPLHAFGRPVGIIELYRANDDPWEEEDVELLDLLIGQLAAVLATLRPIEGDGQAQGTDDVRTREARVRGEQAQRLESLGRLAGAVAHDFNNLLGVILGYAAELEQQLGDAGQRADVAEIRRAAEQAARVTRQLLTFSRRDAVGTESVNICELLRQMESLLRSSLGENTRLELDLDDSLPPLRINRGQFEQVVVNLTFNARDALSDGGVFRIEVTQHTRETGDDPGLKLPPGDYAVLRFADDGAGMDEWVAQRAFEPFFTTKDEPHGTGLGLATVHGIVRQAGGDIVLDSKKGRGTAVTIWLPLAAREDSGGSEQPEPLPAGATGCVLVVEDNPSLRRIIVRMLTGEGYQVLEAVTAEEALDRYAAAGRIDIVLSDVRLPGASGIELVGEMRRRDASLPAVLMTGSLDRAHAEVDLPVLHKPFGRDELLAAMLEARR